MIHSRLEPVKEPARLVRRRFAEVVAYFEHPYANAVLEGADSVVRNVKSVLLQCLFDRFGSVFPQCGLMVFPGVVIVSR